MYRYIWFLLLGYDRVLHSDYYHSPTNNAQAFEGNNLSQPVKNESASCDKVKVQISNDAGGTLAFTSKPV